MSHQTPLTLEDIKINPDYAELVPPLSDEEYKRLKESIAESGLYERIKINQENEILDGHNRYSIAKKYGLPFRTEEIKIKNLSEARVWMIKNQLGKRNLSVFARAELALELSDIVAKAAKKNQLGGVRLNLDEGIDTAKVLVKLHRVLVLVSIK